jgi:hypothetical protein
VSETYHWDTTWAKIDQEDSLSEAWENFKLVAAGLLLFAGFTKRRNWPILPFAFCALYLAADNHFQIHEQIGGSSSSSAPIGEVMFSALVAFALAVAAISLAYVAPATQPAEPLAAASAIGLFGGFAVGADAIHYIFHQSSLLNQPLTVLEDGGEIVAISLLLAVCFAIFHSKGPVHEPADHVLAS